MDRVIVATARRHGVRHDDMLHAYRNPIRVFYLADLIMLIDADEAGRLLEIGVATGEGVEFIVHAWPPDRDSRGDPNAPINPRDTRSR